MEIMAQKQANEPVNDVKGGSSFDVPFAIHTLCQQMTSLHAKVDDLTNKFNQLQSQVNQFMTNGINIQKACTQNKTALSEIPQAEGDADWDSGFQQSTNFLVVPQNLKKYRYFGSSFDSEESQQSAGSDFVQVSSPSTALETRRPSYTKDINVIPGGNTEAKPDGYVQVGTRRNSREKSKLTGIDNSESQIIQQDNMECYENTTLSDAKSNRSHRDNQFAKNPVKAFDSSHLTDTDNTISNFFNTLPKSSLYQEQGNEKHGENSSEKVRAHLMDNDEQKMHNKQPQQTDSIVEDKTEFTQRTITYSGTQQASNLQPKSSSEPTMGQGEPTMDQGEPIMDQGEHTMDQGETAMDQGEPTMDQGEPTMDQGETVMDQEHIKHENMRKRSYAANFGVGIPKPHPPSPVPFSKCKMRTPYSDFKRQKTDFFEDNRSKYFDKMLDVISVGEVDDPVSSVGYSAADVFSTEQLKPGTKGLQLEEPINSFVETTSVSNLLHGSPHPKNNEQIPESGFRNEHGQDDNRFVEEVHTVSAQQSHGNMLSNVAIILTGNPQRRFYGQDILGSSNYDREERNGGAGRNPLNADGTVPDTELAAIIEREKEKAQQCTDLKSTHGIDTVLCLDTSASMKGQPLRKARDFIIRFLEGLDQSSAEYSLEENVAIVTYGSENQVLQHLTKDYSLVRSKLEMLKADGPSPLWLGIGLCLTELSTRGGICSMDSQTLLPRIIIISDFFASRKNLLQGPDIKQLDQKGNSEVTGLINKNKKTCTFNFVTVGQKTNMTLLQQMGRDQLFKTTDVSYLSQYFRAQDLVNMALAEMVGLEVDELFIHNAIKQRGMAERWQRDVIELVKEKTSSAQAVKEVNCVLAPDYTESNAAGVDKPEELEFGTHIKANPNWAEYHSRQTMSGFVLASRKNGWLKVVWEDGTQERVRYGVDGEYDVLVDNGGPGEEEKMIGTIVERGPDWRWADQDGGPGNLGVVFSYNEKKQVVEVLWNKGGKGNYRYGYKGKFDVVVRNKQDRMAMSEQ